METRLARERKYVDVIQMFAEAKGEEDAKPFIDSKLFKIASEYVNSIQLSVQYHYVDEDDEDVNEKEAGTNFLVNIENAIFKNSIFR